MPLTWPVPRRWSCSLTSWTDQLLALVSIVYGLGWISIEVCVSSKWVSMVTIAYQATTPPCWAGLANIWSCQNLTGTSFPWESNCDAATCRKNISLVKVISETSNLGGFFALPVRKVSCMKKNRGMKIPCMKISCHDFFMHEIILYGYFFWPSTFWQLSATAFALIQKPMDQLQIRNFCIISYLRMCTRTSLFEHMISDFCLTGRLTNHHFISIPK